MLLRSLAAIGLADSGGFPSEQWVVRVAGQPGETFTTQFGTYKRVSLDGGGEIWIDIGADGTPKAGQVIGMTPFHSGVGAIKVEVTQKLALDPSDPLVGGWSVVLPALARGDRPLPLTIEIVPYRMHTTEATTFTAYIRVLGLASEATVYPSPAAFLERASKGNLLSLGAIAPLSHAAGAAAVPQTGPDQRCVALVTGSIEEARQITNPLSGQPYFWLVLATDRGRINVVASGRMLLGAPPAIGAVLQAKVRLIATPAGPEALAEAPDFTPPADLVQPGRVGPDTGRQYGSGRRPPALQPGRPRGEHRAAGARGTS